MTDTKFSDFIRNATPEEKAKVYGEVMDEACEMQRKVMSEQQVNTLVRQLAEARLNTDKFCKQAKDLMTLLEIQEGHHERMSRLQAMKPKKAEARLAEVEQKCSALVANWRAVAEKQRKRERESERTGNEWNEAWYGAMAERSEYCADELDAAIAAGEKEGG